MIFRGWRPGASIQDAPTCAGPFHPRIASKSLPGARSTLPRLRALLLHLAASQTIEDRTVSVPCSQDVPLVDFRSQAAAVHADGLPASRPRGRTAGYGSHHSIDARNSAGAKARGRLVRRPRRSTGGGRASSDATLALLRNVSPREPARSGREFVAALSADRMSGGRSKDIQFLITA